MVINSWDQDDYHIIVMDICVEYINRQTYKYQYTYSLPHTHLDNGGEYIYFKLHLCISKEGEKSGYAEIGVIDKETLSLYPCKVKLGHVYVKSAEAKPESLNNYRSENRVYYFTSYLYNKDFSAKKEFSYTGTVHEFAGCCQILNYYIANGFNIDTCQIDKLENRFRHSVSHWGIEAYTMLDVSDNLKYTDFIDFISSAENRAFTECEYSCRRGEYAHDYWETLTFRTDNLAFAEIIERVLHRTKKVVDNHYCIEYEFKEDTDYNGGLSVMIEKEGKEEVTPKGVFKKQTINKIINESCRDFPSELYIICKLISE